MEDHLAVLGALSRAQAGAQVGVLFKSHLTRWKDKHTVQQGHCQDSGFLMKVRATPTEANS